MTRRISSSEQGQLQGAIVSIKGMISMVGETLFTQTSAFFIGSNPPLSPQHSALSTWVEFLGTRVQLPVYY